jgi:catechol 2,3-dioxygenase-like lactoylglutathione lyase family enzyme
MFDHVEVPVSDLSASKRFYTTVLAPLGIDVTFDGPESVELGALVLVPRAPQGRLHIAFIAETRDAVDGFHAAGAEAGYRDNGPPGLREYAPDYYAAYLLDPDGHNIEAVHRAPETRAGWTWLSIGRV